MSHVTAGGQPAILQMPILIASRRDDAPSPRSSLLLLGLHSMTEPNAHTLLDELDVRQDEVLGQLDQLNEQIEDVLEDWTGVPKENEESVDEESVDEEPVDEELVDEAA
ncbi:MAG: hypothetical protein VB855_11755 [Pirellulaceae bacterium]